MQSTKRSVRVRFAPSPTGHLHVGSARSALFNWLFARHHGGTYVVRVEDTDRERSKREYVSSIVESLSWLGLSSDEPLVFQSEREQAHVEVARTLVEQGKAYPCFCTHDPKGAARAGGGYDGTCRGKDFSSADLVKSHAIRFNVSSDVTSVRFADAIRGTITIEREHIDDFVIVRRDGTPTYNFVVVLDDVFMNITHVIRGEDHISNTPKQILLYRALDEAEPVFAHIPLILGKDGSRLSKRDGAVSVVEYKKAGFPADAFFNYLVRLGWAHGNEELFSRQQLIELFTLERVGKKGAVFDMRKLQWLSGVYLRKMQLDTFLDELEGCDSLLHATLLEHWPQEKLGALFDLYKERAATLVECARGMVNLAASPLDLDLGLLKKWYSDAVLPCVEEYLERYDVLGEVDHDALLNIARNVCEEYGIKLTPLAQALRLALTGNVQSPPIFDCLAVLEKNDAKERMQKLVSCLQLAKERNV